MLGDKRLIIFTGGFGSGKTEHAINTALHLARREKGVSLVDLDILKPFFRSRELREELADHGVEVIAPKGYLANADIPALPPEIYRALQDMEHHTVFDVGGDDLGARALGRYHGYFHDGEYDFFMVINIRRPFTDTPSGIVKTLFEIESSSRLKVTGLISNTNLGTETTIEDIIDGYRFVQIVAQELALPLKFVSVPEDLYDQIDPGIFSCPVFPLRPFLRPFWAQEVSPFATGLRDINL